MNEDEQLFRVICKGSRPFVAGFIVKNGVVIRCAPILAKRCLNKPLRLVIEDLMNDRNSFEITALERATKVMHVNKFVSN